MSQLLQNYSSPIQLKLSYDEPLDRPVNVSSIPLRSPFRYPGGKTWFVPRIRKWLWQKKNKPDQFIEPFLGGGIIGLTAAFENLARRVLMVELDEDIASVWKTILSSNNSWLCNEILSFNLAIENVNRILEHKPVSTREKAFKTLLKNRLSRGGILAAGSGIMKTGENGKGMGSRWYPETIAHRIQAITTIQRKIEFIQGDGIKVLESNMRNSDAVFFIDPPYTASKKNAGKRLYTMNELNHEQLFDIASRLHGDFLMTYDNADEVKQMAKRYNLDYEVVSMKNTHNISMFELVISKNLDWLRS